MCFAQSKGDEAYMHIVYNEGSTTQDKMVCILLENGLIHCNDRVLSFQVRSTLHQSLTPSVCRINQRVEMTTSSSVTKCTRRKPRERNRKVGEDYCVHWLVWVLHYRYILCQIDAPVFSTRESFCACTFWISRSLCLYIFFLMISRPLCMYIF